MRSVFVLLFILVFCPFSRAQELVFPNKVFQYLPAPGQFINDSGSGTPEAASGLINGLANPISLGGYGGFIVLGFEAPVANHPENPYGIDLIIYGNASSTHAEPGIVMVMKDSNKNGLPDDVWYEIAGSAHYSNDKISDYQIEYLNPGVAIAANISWFDNNGKTGKIYKNSFHQQPYFPLNTLFNLESDEKLIFRGSLLKGNVSTRDGIFISLPYSFGYADMTPLKSPTISGIPDNPYTSGVIEGDGGDGIDISWAIDSDGNYPDLNEIDFVLIQTAINENAGWLGEISTEIRGIVDVFPNGNVQGQTKMISLEGLPDRVLNSSSPLPELEIFFSGKPQLNEEVHWESSNPDIIQIVGDTLYAKAEGNSELKVSLVSDNTVSASVLVSVVSPESIILNTDNRILHTGNQIEIDFKILSATGKEVVGISPEIVIESPEIVGFAELDDKKIILKGLKPGKTKVYLNFVSFPDLNRQIEIEVIEKPQTLSLSFSMADHDIQILKRQDFEISKTEVKQFTNRFQQGFQANKTYITLADAVICALTNSEFNHEGNSFAFRQDEFGGNGLYLWQVGRNWEYSYGWGGFSGDPDHAKTWFAIVNNEVFASGFDSIQVFEGDCVKLIHVEDSRYNWSHINIIPERNEVSIHENLDFTAEQIDIFPSDEGVFSVSGPFPIVNEPVIVDRSVIFQESDTVTSYTGSFSLSFQKAGKYAVSLANSEVVEITVNEALNANSEIQIPAVYPNPFKDEITIQFQNRDFTNFRIYGIDGSLKFQNKLISNSGFQILNLQDLEKGIYILELLGKSRTSRQKLYKL